MLVVTDRARLEGTREAVFESSRRLKEKERLHLETKKGTEMLCPIPLRIVA